ncbi:MAG: hypothetical protein DSZ05_05480 [Sulfurospirillum sp.]|nr:MAG: hypothetical protein DSZ05_05480 [Sulfurospirillum sp.]
MIHQKKMMHRMFQSVPAEKATLLQTGDAKMFCTECGMNLPMFYKTNHAADVDGKVKQYCSIHCLVEDKEKNGKDLKNIRVVDVQTLKFIPVEKATYVVGSSVKGTMSMTSKYAFADKAAAEAFAKEHGGKVTDFNGAYEEAKKDFANDSAMIAGKQAMMAKKGAMLYAKKCQPTDVKFSSPAEAKAYVMKNGLCKGLNPKQLQAVGLFLSRR